MPVQLTIEQASPFVLERHKETDAPPTFHLRPLKSRTHLQIQARAESGDTGGAMFALACACVIGIDNVTDENNEPLKVEPQPEVVVDGVRIPAGSVPVATLEKLPTEWLLEIGQEITRRNTVTPEDVGK